VSARAQRAVELALERDRALAGETISGRVTPGPEVWAIDLVRVESSPAATLELTAASVLPRADGSFELPVPEDAPPTVAGHRCALTWCVRARESEFPRIADARRTLEIACPA
jgi:hypothetical protein